MNRKKTHNTVLLTPQTFAKGLRRLAESDSTLAEVIAEFGPPPLWTRKPGFATLVLIILEQQVSLASARAVFNRLMTTVTPFSASQLLKTDDKTLKDVGLTRQKLSYCRELSKSLVEGRIDLRVLDSISDAEVRAALTAIKGIGPWTADIYLLVAMRRRDIWPKGDRALETAVRELKGFTGRPSSDRYEEVGAPWRPWRAVAARILWHYYLSTRRKAGWNPP